MNEAALIKRLDDLEQRIAALEEFPAELIRAFERAPVDHTELSAAHVVEPRTLEAPGGASAGGAAGSSGARPAPHAL